MYKPAAYKFLAWRTLPVSVLLLSQLSALLAERLILLHRNRKLHSSHDLYNLQACSCASFFNFSSLLFFPVSVSYWMHAMAQSVAQWEEDSFDEAEAVTRRGALPPSGFSWLRSFSRYCSGFRPRLGELLFLNVQQAGVLL